MISGECGLDPEMWKLKWLGWWTAILLGGPIILDLWNDFQSGAIHSLRDLSDQSYRTEVGGLTIIAGLKRDVLGVLYGLTLRAPVSVRFLKTEIGSI
jgi:hypothetical protein